jgi:hypothetical protein
VTPTKKGHGSPPWPFLISYFGVEIVSSAGADRDQARGVTTSNGSKDRHGSRCDQGAKAKYAHAGLHYREMMLSAFIFRMA